MIDCRRCRNTGLILEEYVDLIDYRLKSPTDPVNPNETMPIHTRWKECPDCLGFSKAPLRAKTF